MFKKKENNLDSILNDCLERMLIGGESMEECLAHYPEHYDELKALLTISMQTKKAVDSIEARPEFKASLRYKISSSVNTAKAPQRSSFKWQARWAPLAVSFCIVLLLSGGGVVAASTDSMPDDPLYNVKLASEQVQLFFTFSEQGKANLYSEFVDERVDEIVAMASQNNIEAIGKSSKRMESQLEMISLLSLPKGGELATFAGTDTQSTCIVTETEMVGEGPQNTSTGDNYIVSATPDKSGWSDIVTKTITVNANGVTTTLTENTGTSATSQWGRTPPAYVTNSSNQAVIDSLYNSLMDLYQAAENASGEVLQSLLEAISILEHSYNIATGNIQ
jgi:hypothetical protein